VREECRNEAGRAMHEEWVSGHRHLRRPPVRCGSAQRKNWHGASASSHLHALRSSTALCNVPAGVGREVDVQLVE